YVIGAVIAGIWLIAIAGMIFGDGGGDHGSDGGLRSETSRPFAVAINRNLISQDAASLRIACDAAEARLARSRNNAEVEDWIEMVTACNAGLDGNWESGQRRMQGLL